MKKYILALMVLVQASFGVGSIYTTFYATPTATTNYRTAKAIMKGSDGSVSANGNITSLKVISAPTVNATFFTGNGSLLTGISAVSTNVVTDNYKFNVTLSKNIYLSSSTTSSIGVIYKDGVPFIHDFHHPTGLTATPNGNNTLNARINAAVEAGD